MTVEPVVLSSPTVFRISAVIRITLLSLYTVLMLPLPFLAQAVQAPVSPLFLAMGIGLGAIIVYGLLTERVIVDEQGIQVTYSPWVTVLPRFRKGWSLSWSQIKALKPRTTGQGGLVYYFLSQTGEGYLLPMRMAGFAKFVAIVQEKTGIDTTDVRPLAQPWMYFIVFGCSLLLGLMDIWTISTALHYPPFNG
ncbi:putative protein slr0269 [Planktothrix tepida]|uniref:Uncharacterized protein n=2 Tax=Planktothrix TaxID=54304 RepID=A0A1J1LQM0_9CYAN|nr:MULTISPECIES: hypothetical protein [Planktothrix]CAD5938277.1 putative protein slr0269 [Planktothrix tepida]CAD5973471.1 putative protein slr0269 [Planktothrix pseudagardhii]CUR33865.1 conserved membrane hypothetical protein [Planktothrix tepida PCC 9214]